MEKVFFICEINLNVLYYRNENYVFVFYVVVNDIKLYKNYYCLGYMFCFQNQNYERSLILINYFVLEIMKLFLIWK